MKEDVEKLTSLLGQYRRSGPTRCAGHWQRPQFPEQAPNRRLTLRPLRKGCEVFRFGYFTWSAVNHRPQEIAASTELDGKPVSVAVEYASLPDGPFYAARTVVSAPQKDLAISIETFDYVAIREDIRSAGDFRWHLCPHAEDEPMMSRSHLFLPPAPYYTE